MKAPPSAIELPQAPFLSLFTREYQSKLSARITNLCTPTLPRSLGTVHVKENELFIPAKCVGCARNEVASNKNLHFMHTIEGTAWVCMCDATRYL